MFNSKRKWLDIPAKRFIIAEPHSLDEFPFFLTFFVDVQDQRQGTYTGNYLIHQNFIFFPKHRKKGDLLLRAPFNNSINFLVLLDIDTKHRLPSDQFHGNV
jgi:hypothetical protein